MDNNIEEKDILYEFEDTLYKFENKEKHINTKVISKLSNIEIIQYIQTLSNKHKELKPWLEIITLNIE